MLVWVAIFSESTLFINQDRFKTELKRERNKEMTSDFGRADCPSEWEVDYAFDDDYSSITLN